MQPNQLDVHLMIVEPRSNTLKLLKNVGARYFNSTLRSLYTLTQNYSSN